MKDLMKDFIKEKFYENGLKNRIFTCYGKNTCNVAKISSRSWLLFFNHLIIGQIFSLESKASLIINELVKDTENDREARINSESLNLLGQKSWHGAKKKPQINFFTTIFFKGRVQDF